MASYTGLFLRLKDKQTGVPDKLKLAKFAWVNDAVHIPNKHQQILDFVCGLLVNRKKHNITSKDVLLIWKTLDTFLHLSGTGSVVKPSILQAVNDDLSAFILKGKPQKRIGSDLELMQHILRSTHCLVGLQSVTAYQFEALCVLLSTVSQLLVNSGPHTTKLDTELEALLKSVVSVLTRMHKTHLNQGQVLNCVTDKVLSVSLKVLHKIRCLKLQEFLLGCLLHRDHQEMYAVYLRHIFGEPGQGHIKQAPKSIGNVFTVLSSHFSQSESSAYTDFIPEFMKAFVSQNKSDPRLCYLMLKQLARLLLSPEDGGDNNLFANQKLKAVAQCMSACNDCDLFSASSEANDILKWCFQLTEQVLKKQRSPSWFSYMRAALNLNHLIVEKFWEKILDLGFTRAHEISEDCYGDQDMFLADLVGLYIKLRRSPDLLSACLSSVELSASGTDVYGHTPHFYNRLCQMFSEAPLGSLLDMWETLQDMSHKLVGLLESQPKESSSVYSRLHWVLNFYTVLLGNARLFNHRGVGVLFQKVNVLMKRLEDEILVVLSENEKINKNCPSLKQLLSVWAVVKMLLFPKWRESAQTVTEKLNDKMVDSVEQFSKNLDSVTKLQVTVQRQSLASVYNTESVEEQCRKRTSIEGLVEELLEIPVLSREDVFKVLTDHCNQLSALEQSAHRFRQFSQLFPQIGASLSERLIDRLVNFIVGVLSLGMAEDLNRRYCDGTTLFTEVELFLANPATKEVKVFQDRLSVAMWKTLLSGSSDAVLSPRKKKVRLEESSDTQSLAKVVHFLTNHEVQDDRCILNFSHIKKEIQVLPHFSVLIKVLEQQDLEYLPVINLRCQLGACVLMASSGRSESHDKFRKSVAQLMVRCLSVPNLSRLFECVKPTELLDFAIRACSQDNSLGYELLKVTVQAVMNDHEAVLAMVAFARKLTKELQTGSGVDGVSTVKTLAWIVRNCHRYVTKSFHISSVRSAALEIYFSVAKFVVKHGLEWFEKAKLAHSPAEKSKTMIEKVIKTKKRKRKISESCDDDGHHEQKRGFHSLFRPEDLYTEAWCSLLECVCEILHLWTKEVVDDKFNEHLAMMVAEILKRVMSDLESDFVPSKTKVAELAFITACCHCHMRCNQATLGPSASTAVPHPDQSSGNLCLLHRSKLEEIWNTCFLHCVREFSDEQKIFTCSEASPGEESQSVPMVCVSDKRIAEEEGSFVLASNIPTCKKVYIEHPVRRSLESSSETEDQTHPKREFLEHMSWSPDQMETWPECVTSYVDVLTSVVECCDVAMFRLLMNKMNELLVPASEVEPVTVFVVIAVWRRLFKSQVMPDDHIQEMFANMYQVLSIMLSLVQYYENSKSFCTTSLSSSSSSSTAASLPLSRPMTTMHDASRFILEAVSDFVDLRKMLISPRMTLLCLNVGLIFTLSCPSDLETLYRLINTLLVHHTNTALRAVPSVVCVANKLLSSCIELGCEDNLDEKPKQLQELLHCAQHIARLLTLLSSSAYKADLSKVAHNIIAEYVIGIQRSPVHTAVKRELVQGLYKVMSICDKFRLAALNASLPAGVKDIFKILHQDYEKYHRYSGFV